MKELFNQYWPAALPVLAIAVPMVQTRLQSRRAETVEAYKTVVTHARQWSSALKDFHGQREFPFDLPPSFSDSIAYTHGLIRSHNIRDTMLYMEICTDQLRARLYVMEQAELNDTVREIQTYMWVLERDISRKLQGRIRWFLGERSGVN